MKSRQWLHVLATLAFAVVPFVTFAESGSWKLDLSVSGYSGAETLTDFPVLVRLPADFPYADCGEGGATIRFTDTEENLLSHEIDTWNPSGESLVWVKLPSLAPSGTTFSLFFGDVNPHAGTSVDSRQTWSRYAAVVHGGTANGLVDATGNLTVSAGSTSVTASDSLGKIGGGIAKSTNNSIGLNVQAPGSTGGKVLTKDTCFTVSAWFYRDGNGGSGNGTHILGAARSAWNDASNGWMWNQEKGQRISVSYQNNHALSKTSPANVLADKTWGFAAFSYDKDNSKTLKAYFSDYCYETKTNCGQLEPTSGNGTTWWTFGSYANAASTDSLKGAMDEIRIFNGAASADWVKAEFEAASKADFLTMGEIEAYIVDGPDPIVAGFVATATSFADATVSFNVPWAGAGAETVEAVLKYGLAADALTETLDLGQITGEQVVNLPLLTPGATYYFKLTVDNGLADPVVKELTVSVPAESFPEISASGSSLPAGYTQLKYIESTGKQRIPLNVYPELGWSMEMDFMVPAKESGKAFFGCSYSSTSGNGWCLINNSQFMWDRTDREIWKYTGETMDNMLNQDLHMRLDESGIVFSSAARTYPKWYGIAPTAKNGNYQFALFTTYNNYSSYYSKYRLYGFKIYDATGALVRDLVPATEQSTGYHGVYDKVEGKFYGSDQNKTTAFNIGQVTSVAAQLTVAGVSKMGAALMATVTRPDLSASLGNDATLDRTITVYYGDTYGGSDPSAWSGSAVAGAFEPGTLTATVSPAIATAKFARFYSPVGGWSPVVLPEAAPTTSAADPLVLKPAVAEVGPCFAKVSLPVLAMGEGATGFSVEAICARGAAEIVQTVATGVTAPGTLELTVPLAVGAAQSIAFRVTNNLGKTAVCAATDVTTPAEDGQATVVLPDGGTTLEYVESSPATGALYVDTGYIHNNDTKIVCVMSTRHVEWSTGSNWYSAFGAKRNSSPRGGIRFAFRCAQYLPYTMCCSWAETTTTPNIGTKFFPYATKVQVVTDAEAGGVSWQWQDEITGEVRSDSIAGMSGDRDGQCPLLIFAANETDTQGGVGATNKAYMKLYRFVIYEKGVLVRDFVPALDPNGKAALYERIQGQYVYATGNDLAAGPAAGQPLYGDTLAGAGLETTSTAFDGTTLEVGLSRDGKGGFAAGALKVCYGATAGGSDMAAWEHVETLAYGFAAGQDVASAAFAVPAGTKYVRFYSEMDGWSDTITVPYLAVTTSSAPAVSALAMTEIGAYAGELVFNLTSLGAGADHCDLKVVYGHDEFTYTNVLPAVTAAGPQTVTISGLVPSTNYTLKVVADNGLAGGAVETDAIAFTTAAEPYPVAKAVIPDTIQLLTYIESTGKQWVDTGLKPALGDDLTLDLNCYLISCNDKCLMGTANSNDGTWRLRAYNNQIYFDGVKNGAYGSYPHSAFTSSDWKKDLHLVIDSNDRVTVEIAGKDSVTYRYVRASRSNHAAAAYNIALFGAYGGSSLSLMRLYDCTFWKDGVPVRAFYPAKQTIDGVTKYGLYDIVNGEFHGDSANSTTLFNIGEVRELVPDSAPATDAALTFGESIYDGSTLTVELNRNMVFDNAEDAVYACFGVNAGDLDRADWDKGSASVGTFGAGSDKSTVTVSSIPAGARYVRFCTSSGVWSPVVFLPECPKTVMVDPMLIVSGVSDVFATSARFTGTVPSLGEGATKATLRAYIQPDGMPEVEEQDVLTISADAESPAIDFFVLGLDPGLAYTVRFRLENDLGGLSALSDAFAFTTLERNLIDATVSGDDSYVEKTFDTKEKALVFTNGAAAATFSVSRSGYAEVLLVGGGGGGGTEGQGGGGGGAGGYLHFDSMFFPAGTYTITVGAGGAKGSNQYGGRKGGDTSIVYAGAGEFATVTAYGGGGGASTSSGRMQDKSQTYGSTGGAANGRAAKTHGDYTGFTPTYGQGNYGGDGYSGVNTAAGGGGGAGAEGQGVYQQGGVWTGGNGGNGRACAISGKTLYYAGGGGGSGAVGGEGGLGGGGRGYNATAKVLGTDGVDGLGGGGGGGGYAKIDSSNVYYLTSGNGGSGTVIIRFVPYSDDIDETPVAQLVSVEGTTDLNGVPAVSLAARVVSVGAGDAAEAVLEYGFSEDRLIKTAVLEASCPIGDYSWRFVGLRAETPYFARLRLTDETGAVAYSRILPFTTPAGDETGIDPARPLIDAVGQVGSENARITLQVSGTALWTNENAEARLFIGTTPANLALDATAKLVSQDAGSVVIGTDAIDFGATCYYVVEVNNGLDVSRSEPVSFKVSEVGELLSGSVRIVSDPEHPERLIVEGTIAALGVGSSVAHLYLGISQDALTEYASTPVSEAGEIRFESEIAYGAYFVKIVLENTFKGSKRTTESAVASGVVADRSHYLWCGRDGLWDESSNWTVNGEPATVAPNGAAAAGGVVYGPLADFPAGTYTIDVDRDLSLGTREWDGTTKNGFIFAEGANVTLRSTKEPWILGNGVNGLSLVSPKNGTLVLDGVSYQPGQNTSLQVAQGSTVILTNDAEIAATGYGAVSVGQDGRLVVCEGAVLRDLFQSDIAVTGAGAELRLAGGAIDNPTMGLNLGNAATLVLEGAAARAAIGSDNTVYCNAGADTTGTISFVIAPGGYTATPLVLAESKGAKAFGATGSGKVLVSVDPASPAVTFDGDTETMLVTCKKGISFEQDGGKVVLGDLPEGAAYFYTYDNTEAREGALVTGVGVKILGRGTEPAAPLVQGLRNRACTETSATLAFTGRLGGGTATSATYAYRFAKKGETQPAEFTALGEQDSLVKDYEIALTGLAADTVYTLEVKGVSSDGERIVPYDFSTVCGILEVASASGLTLGSFGPYTDVDYVSGAAEGTLVLTRGGSATVQGETKNLPSGTYAFTTKGGVVTVANEGGEAVFSGAVAEGEKVSLRLVTREIDNAPILDLGGAVVVGKDGVTVPVAVHGFGGEKTTASGCTSLTASLKWGFHPEFLTETKSLGAVAEADLDEGGTVNLLCTGLPADKLVYAQVVGDNGEAEGVGASRVFTIRGKAAGVGTGSLIQYHKTGNQWYTGEWDFSSDLTAVEVRGPMAALYGNNTGALDGQKTWTDVDGVACQNWQNDITFAYVGYLYLDAEKYTFGGSVDDHLKLTVYPLGSEGKGEALYTLDMSSSSFKTGSLTVGEPGWYPVEFRAGNGSGNYGAWAKYLCYNLTGATAKDDASWIAMLDTGDGKLFSTEVPAAEESSNTDPSGPNLIGVKAVVPTAETVRFTATATRTDGYTLLVADDETMTQNRTEIAPSAADADGIVFTGDFIPKATYYMQLVATNAAGKAFAQMPVAVTIPQEAYFKTGPTVTSDQAMLNVSGTVEPGLGETTMLASFRVGVGEWSAPQAIAVYTNGVSATPWKVAWSENFTNDWGNSVSYRFTISNATDTASWATQVAEGVFTVKDTATYTWIANDDGNGTAYRWGDPANWTCSKPASAIGYPTATASVAFDAGGTADVTLDADRAYGAISFSGNGTRVVFAGPYTLTGPANSGVTTCSGTTPTVGVKDGATWRVNGDFQLGAKGTTVLVDNATLHVNNFLYDNGNNNWSETKLVFRGANPQLVTQGYFGANKQNTAPFTVVLEIPYAGWREPLIVGNGLTAKYDFAQAKGGGTCKIHFEIDPKSQFLKRGVTKRMTVVDWAGVTGKAFNTANMEMTTDGKPQIALEGGEKLTKKFLFGFDDGNLLRLTLRGHGGFVIFIE